MPYIVLCRRDSTEGVLPDGSRAMIPGSFEQATRRTFDDFDVARCYAGGIAYSRDPLIVELPCRATGTGAVTLAHHGGDGVAVDHLNSRCQTLSASRDS